MYLHPIATKPSTGLMPKLVKSKTKTMQIQSLSKSSKIQSGFLPLEELLSAFYEDNARDHSLENDIVDLAYRMLALGWCEHITLNQKLNRIVDGHGRVLACQWLSNQSPDWFETRLAIARQRNITTEDEQRYSPLYWTNVSVIIVSLDSDRHAAMNLGLNNEKAFGVDDPDKVAKISAGFNDEDRAIAGFGARLKAIATEIKSMPDSDFQDKQYFERPDATDYSVRNEDTQGDVMPVTVSDSDDDDLDGEFEGEDKELETEAIARDVFVPKLLNLSLPWTEWKRWKKWKDEHGIDKDADALWKGLQMAFPDDLSFAAKKEEE